jgi:hypothetical protein
MLRKKVAVRPDRVRAAGVLPIAILPKLRDAHARLRHELAFRVALNELTVSVDAVGRFR